MVDNNSVKDRDFKKSAVQIGFGYVAAKRLLNHVKNINRWPTRIVFVHFNSDDKTVCEGFE